MLASRGSSFAPLRVVDANDMGWVLWHVRFSCGWVLNYFEALCGEGIKRDIPLCGPLFPVMTSFK